jgi:RNA polymerase sigma-70 factor (ECF subfamily)
MRRQTYASPRGLDLESIYRTELAFVLSCLRGNGVREPDVHDRADEVFLRAFLKPTSAFDRPLRPWLEGIANNVAKEGKRAAARPADPVLSTPTRMLQPDEILEQKEEQSLLATALERVDPDRREIFILARLEDMTAPEIARITSLRVSTVYSIIRLARRDLIRELGTLRRLPLSTTARPTSIAPRRTRPATPVAPSPRRP